MSFELCNPSSCVEKSGGKNAEKSIILKEKSVVMSESMRFYSPGPNGTESRPRSCFTYRPKPAFGADGNQSCSGMSFSAPTSTLSRSSNYENSSDFSPTGTWPSTKCSIAAEGGSDGWEDPSSFNSAAGLCRRNAPSAGTKKADWKGIFLDVERGASWSQYLDISGEHHYETPERRHMVDMSQLFLGQKFACGTYSRLYRGQYKNQEVAVKIVRQPEDDKEMAHRLERQFGQEVSLLSRLHHINVVQFVGAMKKAPVFCIITEYLGGGSLRAFLHKNQGHPLPIDTVLALALDIARGMEYLHSQGVLHLDLKSHNLVLAENQRVKVTDFGIARTQSECESMTPDAGTYRWMAPEMISNKHFSGKADVYGFGIILWEIITGHTPYEDMSTVQAAFAVVDKHVRPPIPDYCPRALKHLMEECWSAHPEKRPRFWQIVKRLEEFQDSICQNETCRSLQLEHVKQHWFWPFLHRFKVCVSEP